MRMEPVIESTYMRVCAYRSDCFSGKAVPVGEGVRKSAISITTRPLSLSKPFLLFSKHWRRQKMNNRFIVIIL